MKPGTPPYPECRHEAVRIETTGWKDDARFVDPVRRLINLADQRAGVRVHGPGMDASDFEAGEVVNADSLFVGQDDVTR
jgi:hypothetical protein